MAMHVIPVFLHPRNLQAQLQEVRSTLKWQKTPDHYKVLALDKTCRSVKSVAWKGLSDDHKGSLKTVPTYCSDEDVRRAYRKAALKYHPDKAAAACRYGNPFRCGNNPLLCELDSWACPVGPELCLTS